MKTLTKEAKLNKKTTKEIGKARENIKKGEFYTEEEAKFLINIK